MTVRRLLIVLGLVLVGVVVAAIVAFPRVAPPLLAGRLEAMGFADARIERVEVGLAHAALVGIELGDGQSVGRIETGFRIADLVRGRLASLVVENLSIRARLDGDGLTIPGLTPVADGSDAGPPLLLPERALLRNARMTLETPYGTSRAELDATLVRDGEEVGFDLEAGRLAGDLFGGDFMARIEGDGRIRPFADDPLRSLVADLTVHGEGGGFAIEELAHIGRSEASVAISVADGLLSAHDLLLEGRIESIADPDFFAGLGAGLPIEIRLKEAGEPAAIEVDLNRAAPAVAADLPFEVRAGEVAATVDLRGGTELGAAGEILAIDLERLRLLATGLRIPDFGSIGSLELALQGSGTMEAAEGDGRLQAQVDGAPDGPFAGAASLDLPFAMTLTADAVALALAEGARVDLAEVSLAGLVRASSGRFVLGGTGDPVLILDRPGHAWTLDLPAKAAGLRVDPATSTGVPSLVVPQARLGLQLAGRGAEVGEGTLRLAGAEARVEALGLRVTGLAATVPFTPSGLPPGKAVELSLGTIRDLIEPRRFATMTADATLTADAGRLTFTGRLRAAEHEAATIRTTGEHRPGSGEGRASIVMEPLRFAPGGLQPRTLSPAFAGVARQVEGAVALAGEVTWGGDGEIGSDLEILIEDLALTAGPARLEGMAGVVVVDGLLPPSTRPDQRLAIGLMEVGLAFTDGTVLFELLPGGPLEVRRLRFDWAGGRIESDPFTVGSPENAISMVLHARGLDLDAIFRQVKLPGLRGEGTIDGTLPLRIEGAEAVIDGGELAARGPGWLRYRPDGSPDAFAAGGESMALLLQALENFRYEDLRITLDGRTDAAMDIGLHLGGANPDLYDGHPVEFNLNLEGELANILEQGLRSYTLPDRVRERIQRYRGR